MVGRERSSALLFVGYLVLVGLMVNGCSDPAPDSPPPSPITDIQDSDSQEESSFCEPGKALACGPGEESNTVLLCNEEGTEAVETPCLGPDGESLPCEEDRCWECSPGSRTCGDGNTVLECDETGRFQVVQECSDVNQGLVCNSGNCIRLCELNRKFNSYIGCEYWAVDLDNAFVQGSGGSFFDAAGSQFAIVVGNPNEEYPAYIEVFVREEEGEVPLTLSSTGALLDLSPIEAGALRVLNVPRRDVDGSGIFPNAFRVVSSVPVTMSQFNPLDNTTEVYSNDASLLLPTDVLGKYYIAMTREQTFDDLRSFVSVVATVDGTQVAFTSPVGTLASNGLEPLTPGETVLFDLNRYDVLNLETDQPGDDLTGSLILANEPVAVFGGSEAANAPNTATCLPEGVCAWDEQTPCEELKDCLPFNTCCADHLEQQLFPVKTWGTRFIATKSKARGEESDIWRIIAAEDDTVIETIPSQGYFPVLDRGEFWEFETREDFEIIGTKPIMVGQFLAAEDAPGPNFTGVIPGEDGQPGDAGIGDPAFILLVPVEQYRDSYVLFVPEGYEEDYVNVIAPHDKDVLFDGEPIPKGSYVPVSAEYRVAILSLTDGKHTLNGEVPFGVIAYGFDEYVSYGYPGGLDLKDLGLINETLE